MPLPLDKVYPINEIVRVDYFLPGCPPSGDAIWKFLTDLILGRMPRLEPQTAALRLSGAPQCSISKPPQAPHKLRRIAIEPVTRVEGHGKVTILLDEDNRVHQVRLHIVEFRGFEAFIEGPALLGGAGHGAAAVRHLPGQPSPRRRQGDGPHRRLRRR